MQMTWCCWLFWWMIGKEAPKVEEWIRGKEVEGECRENESK